MANHPAPVNPQPLLMQNILAQPAALAQTLARQLGPGLPDLLAAAAEIRRAGSVLFTGMGSPYFACLPLVRALKQAGLPASLALASDLLHDFEAYPEAGGLVVLESRSGESVEILRLLPLLRSRGARLLAVTNVPDSSLAKQADLAIFLDCPADEMVAVQTYTATLLANALLGQAARDPASLEPGSAEPGGPYPGRPYSGTSFLKSVETLLAQVQSAIHHYAAASLTWGLDLAQARAVYLLARRSALASALEGALLFHEVAKTPAVAMDAGEFRHGPAEVLDSRFYGIIFAPAGPAQALNIALAHDITRLGGRASLVGSPPTVARAGAQAEGLPTAAPLADWWPIDPAPELLSPILEILPLQFAAYRLAEAQDLHPGQFRICSQVTSNETGFSDL